MSAYRRYEEELEISRRIAIERDIAMSRRIQLDRLDRQAHFLRLKEAQKIRAEQEYDEYLIRRNEEQRFVDAQLYNEKMEREAQLRHYEKTIEEERLARQIRDRQLQAQQRIAEEETARKAELESHERKIQLEAKQKRMVDRQREAVAVADEQAQQEKLERELAQIELAIGSIYDNRERRKKLELEQLEELDKKSFKLKQAMRSSKVKQEQLQKSLAELSKLIV